MLSRLFKFDTLITPSILKFCFYFGVVVFALLSLGVIGSGLKIMDYSFIAGIGYILGGIILFFAGVVFSRVSTEMVLVLFMVRDELAWQRESRQNGAAE